MEGEEDSQKTKTSALRPLGADFPLSSGTDGATNNYGVEHIRYSLFSRSNQNRLWAFRMVLVFGGIGAGNIYIKNYVPTIAVSQGASLDQAAILVTLIGVVDLISRLSLGFFADTHLLKPSQIVAASHVVLGKSAQRF